MPIIAIRRRALLAGASLAATFHVTGAHAQSDDPREIEEIVVTATKRETALRNIPISISAETAADLERRGAVQIDDIVANAPGLSNPGGGANQANLVVRGVTTGTSAGLQQSTVALFIDDLPADPGAGGLSTTDLRLFDIERVEVLRGPQGTLFGSGSLSGAVRIITSKPDLDDMSALVEVTGKGTKGGKNSGDVNLMINAPLAGGVIGVRAVGYASYLGGDIDNRVTGATNVNWARQYGGRFMMAAEPSEPLSLLFTAIYQNSKSGSAGYDSYEQPVGRNRSRASPVEGYVDLQSTIFNVVGRYAFSGVDFTSSTSYSTKELLAIGNGSAYVTLLGNALDIPDLEEATPTVTPSKSDTFTQELRLSSSGSGPFNWTVGAYYQSTDGKGGQSIESSLIGSIVGVASIQNLRTKSKETEKALFGEATYAVDAKLDLTAGVRVGRSSIEFETNSSGVLLTGDFSPDVVIKTRGEQSETSVNPRLALTYRPSNNLTLFLQASKGFRTGGPNLTAGLSPTPPPTTYNSDSLWNFEFGQRLRLADGLVQLNTTVYYIDWSDIQASLYKGIAYTGNAGDARVYGLEAELVARPLPELELGSALSLNRGELTKNVADIARVSGVIGANKGDRLPASPTVKVSAYAQGSFDLAGKPAYLRADVQYVGEQFTDFGKAGLPFGNFTTVNLRAGVNLGNVELVAFVNNLLNSAGKMSAVDETLIGMIQLGERSALRVRPVSAGLTVRGRF